MANELLRKIKELEKLVIERNNKEFKSSAIEQINPNKVDEHVLPNGEEHMSPEKAEVMMEIELLGLEALIRKAITSEDKAIMEYVMLARKATEGGFYPLADIFKELASDEMIHEAQLREILNIYGFEDMVSVLKGKIEAREALGLPITEDGEEHLARMRELRVLADRERKNFDFVGEYVKDKVEYNKEKVVDAVNDLIAGKSDLANAVERIIKDGKKVAKKKEDKPKKKGSDVEKSEKQEDVNKK